MAGWVGYGADQLQIGGNALHPCQGPGKGLSRNQNIVGHGEGSTGSTLCLAWMEFAGPAAAMLWNSLHTLLLRTGSYNLTYPLLLEVP